MMKKIIVIVSFRFILCLSMFVVACLCYELPSQPTPNLTKPIQSGMTFTGDKYCPNVTFSSSSAKESLYHLYTTGANWVAIVVTQYQKYHNSTEIFPLYTPIYSSYYTYITATLDELSVAIDEAHQLNLKVMFKPHIDLTEDDEYWRGQIGDGLTDEQWDQWFVSYGNMILEYAKFAQEKQVEQFSVSCELIVASRQTEHWRELIKEIRGVYSGVLIDSANWGWLNETGGEDTQKLWWGDVDIIGIDAYYVSYYLQNISDPTLEQILEQWQPVIERFKNLTSFFQRPLVLSEVGYCPGPNCDRGIIPTLEGLNLMARFYQAVFEALLPYDWFWGAFWWNWTTDNSFGGDLNNCMTPSYKPAENVLRYYYQAELPIPPQPTSPPLCLCTL